MKKRIIIALACTIYLAAIGCQVLLENDTNTWVSVTDLKAFGTTEFVKKRKKINANKDPQEFADLRIVIGSSPEFISNPNADPAKQTYRVTQIACSQSHIIPVTASSIKNGTLNPAIFTMEKERTLTKRFKGE